MITGYTNLAVKLVGEIVDKHPGLVRPVELTVPKSGMEITPKNYVSMIFLTSLFTYFISLILFWFVNLAFLNLNPLVSILFLIFIPVLSSLGVFLLGIFYPYERALSRAKDINVNLPFALAHMGSIATSGIPPTAIFKLLAGFKEYGVLAEEIRKIVRNIEVFGLDPISAMREVAKRTPSEKFKQLLSGLASTIEGGGDLKTYLKNAGEQSLFMWRMKRQKYVQQLSTYAEFYTGLLIAAPLFIISLFSIMYLVQPQVGSFDILRLMKLSTYLLIPALNAGFLMFLQITQVEM